MRQNISQLLTVDPWQYDVPLASACALVSMDFAGNANAREFVLAELQRSADVKRAQSLPLVPNCDMILRTLSGLGQKAQQAAPILVKLLDDDLKYEGGEAGHLEFDEKTQIAITLGKIDPDARESTDTLVRELLLLSLRVDDKRRSPLLQFGKASIWSLINGLTEFSENEYHIIRILEVLGEFGERADDAILIVIRISQDERRDVRAAAAKTIGMIGTSPEVAVPALVRLLNDERPVVREQAAISLAAYKTHAASAKLKLTELINDEYIDVRLAAESALEVVK